MTLLMKSIRAWGTPAFQATLQQEIEQLDARHLPLQQALSVSSHVSDRPVQAMVLGAVEEAGFIRAKVGIFYTGVISGCNCADDPSPIDEQNEYCVIAIVIDRLTAETSITLLPE